MRKLFWYSGARRFISWLLSRNAITFAEAGGHQVARHDEDIKVRAAAALKEEPDLLTFSVQTISRGKTEEAVQVYMKGYSDKKLQRQHEVFGFVSNRLAVHEPI